MIQVRPCASIYHAEGVWFSANWHFSFDRYYDRTNMGWGTLRVFNDDRLVPGAAWPMHPHRDIEGITYVAEGSFEHANSRGHGGVLSSGSVQRVTLGSGMEHSEMNHSKTEPLRFIQMWTIPSQRGLLPSVEQRSFTDGERRNTLRAVLVPAAGFGGVGAPSDRGAITVHQDAALYGGLPDPGRRLTHRVRGGFGNYCFAVHGYATIQAPGDPGGTIDEGGAARIRDVSELSVAAGDAGAELVLVEVAL